MVRLLYNDSTYKLWAKGWLNKHLLIEHLLYHFVDAYLPLLCAAVLQQLLWAQVPKNIVILHNFLNLFEYFSLLIWNFICNITKQTE